MNRAVIKAICLAAGVLFLAACSTDPNKQKLNYLNSGEQYLKRGEYQAAVIQFRNAIALDPKFAAAHYQLAQTYLGLNNRDAALAELQQTVTLDPGNSEAQLELAPLLLAHHAYEQSQAALSKVLKNDPNNAKAHAELGEKYAATRDTEHAILELQKAIDLDPTRIEYYSSLAALRVSLGEGAAAEATYEDAIKRNPTSLEARLGFGEFYFAEGKFAEAEQQMLVASQLDSHAVLPRLLLARTYIAMHRLSDAEKVDSELKTVAPDDPQAYQALGLLYSSTGQKEKAVAEFRSLMASKPNDNSVKADLAENLVDLNRIEEATVVDQELLKLNASDPRGLVIHGRILIVQGKFGEAASELESATKSDSRSANAFYFLGVAQQSEGLASLAKSSFSHAIELNPGMTRATLALANLASKSGAQDEASRLAGNALKANPDSAMAYVAGARAALAKGDVRQGRALLEEALKRDPSSLAGLAMLVKVDGQQGKSRDALARISSALSQQPQNAGLNLLLALAYYDLKDLVKAEASVREAIKLDPRTPEAYTLLADIDFAKGSVEIAKSDLHRAIELNPRNTSNYLALGAWYARDANWDEARKLWEKAHDIDPASPEVAGQLAALYLDHGGDVNVALSLAQAAKRALPNSAPAADTLGWAYYKIGSAALAVQQLQQSVNQAPTNPIFLYHLGKAQMAAGNKRMAKQLLESVLQRTPDFAFATDARDTLKQISAVRSN